jgi:hypothetical protein
VRNPAKRKTTATTVLVLGMALVGASAAAYFYFADPAPAAAPAPAPAGDPGSPEIVAKAVVDRLNAKDLDGVIELTCAQGKATGRRELVRAIPPLDPAAPAETRNVPLAFQLRDVREFPEGYVAAIAVSFQGTSHDGKMRIQRTGEKWTLCGMDSPQISGTGIVGSG